MPPSLALPPSFLSRKARILSSLSVPEGSYTDASPKGSVDEGIRNLISWLNGQEGYVTTSSCAGRISVFAEGNKDGGESGHTTVANTSGKGGGGRWLFVSHEPVNVEEDIHELLGIKPWEVTGEMLETGLASKARYIRFAFEPMILHVLCATLSHARPLLSAAINAGFRESGVQSLKSLQDCSSCPMVGIRTTGGVAMQSIIGFVNEGGEYQSTVPEGHLRMLLESGNGRFDGNVQMKDKFWRVFRKTLELESVEVNGLQWEDSETRKARKRSDGLKRRDELSRKESTNPCDGNEGLEEANTGLMIFEQLDPNG